MYASMDFASGTLPVMTRLDGTTWTSQRTALSTGDINGISTIYPSLWYNVSPNVGTYFSSDIGVGANGTVWTIGVVPSYAGYQIFKYSAGVWTQITGGAVRVAVDPNGNAWVVDNTGVAYFWGGSGWISHKIQIGLTSFNSSDIGVGLNGSVWATTQDGSLFKWTGSTWQLVQSLPGGSGQISVDNTGRPWIVNSYGKIYRLDGNNWTSLPGLAKDIGCGADGSVYIISTTPISGGYQVMLWSGSVWKPIVGGGTNIAVGPTGKPWVISNLATIFTYK